LKSTVVGFSECVTSHDGVEDQGALIPSRERSQSSDGRFESRLPSLTALSLSARPKRALPCLALTVRLPATPSKRRQELIKAERAFLEEQLDAYFTEKLLRVVRDMQRHMGTGAADVSDPSHTFPQRCGSHLTEAELGPPALAFVRAVLEVLTLTLTLTPTLTLPNRTAPRTAPEVKG